MNDRWPLDPNLSKQEEAQMNPTEPPAPPARASKQAEADRRWREANPEKAREKTRRWRAANPEKVREGQHRWRAANPARARELAGRYRSKLRTAVFDHYGHACACCGATTRLCIDHINGDGPQHRARVGGGWEIYRWLIRNGFPPGFQTLCRPCNSSKKNGPQCRLSHGETA